MALVSIGSVEMHIGVPTFSEGAEPDSHGITPFGVSGLLSWATARTLKEMVANPDGRVTRGGQTGPPAYLIFTGPEQEAITGYYLLKSFTLGPASYTHRKIGRTPFSLVAAYLGDVA